MPPISASSRRSFLKQSTAVYLAATIRAPSAEATLSAPEGRPAALAPSAFTLLSLGSIRPHGWLLRQLRIQADGLSGHLAEVWPDVGSTSGWLGGKGESWERGPYYLDGLVPLAYLLHDEALIAKARKYIEWTLSSQQPNGMFGPTSNDDWWPRMAMLKVLTQYAEASDDQRVEPFLHRYFAYQLDELPKRPLQDWGKFRWQDNLLSVLWLYERKPDSKLLELAGLLHLQGHDWIGQFQNFQFTKTVTPELFGNGKKAGLSDIALSTHGVNNGQAIKAGPVWYRVSGQQRDHDGAMLMIRELDQFHGLPNGMFSCDEHLAGRDPSHGSELCTVVEYMFSLEQALAITGDPAFGDRLEKLAYNALPGTFTDDMWAHQYNQEPNQVECSLHRKPWTTDGPESNLYGLEPNFGCCTANFSQGWPKFASSLFMRTNDDGLAITAYAPCEVTTYLRGRRIKITQATEYPFRGSIRLDIEVDKPTEFPLRLRIPAWASSARISIKGETLATPTPGTFAAIQRLWKNGDSVTIEFPMDVRFVRGFRDSVSVERGPLVFSYDIGEHWLEWKNRGQSRDWQVYPTRPWNYALSVSDVPNNDNTSEHAMGYIPFGAGSPAVKITLSARRLPSWVAIDGVAETLPASPVQSTAPMETIDLIPYAAAKLRITSFPSLGIPPVSESSHEVE